MTKALPLDKLNVCQINLIGWQEGCKRLEKYGENYWFSKATHWLHLTSSHEHLTWCKSKSILVKNIERDSHIECVREQKIHSNTPLVLLSKEKYQL